MERQRVVSDSNYNTLLQSGLQSAFNENKLCDVMLVTRDGEKVKAHLLVLVIFSKFFQRIANSIYNKTVLFKLNVESNILKTLIAYMYSGQLSVSPSTLKKTLDAAALLEMEQIHQKLLLYSSWSRNMNSDLRKASSSQETRRNFTKVGVSDSRIDTLQSTHLTEETGPLLISSSEVSIGRDIKLEPEDPYPAEHRDENSGPHEICTSLPASFDTRNRQWTKTKPKDHIEKCSPSESENQAEKCISGAQKRKMLDLAKNSGVPNKERKTQHKKNAPKRRKTKSVISPVSNSMKTSDALDDSVAVDKTNSKFTYNLTLVADYCSKPHVDGTDVRSSRGVQTEVDTFSNSLVITDVRGSVDMDDILRQSTPQRNKNSITTGGADPELEEPCTDSILVMDRPEQVECLMNRVSVALNRVDDFGPTKTFESVIEIAVPVADNTVPVMDETASVTNSTDPVKQVVLSLLDAVVADVVGVGDAVDDLEKPLFVKDKTYPEIYIIPNKKSPPKGNCPYCEGVMDRLSSHLLHKHTGKPEVQELVKLLDQQHVHEMTRTETQREIQGMLNYIQNKPRHEQNLRVLKNKSGELQICCNGGSIEEFNVGRYDFCRVCLEWLVYEDLVQHYTDCHSGSHLISSALEEKAVVVGRVQEHPCEDLSNIVFAMLHGTGLKKVMSDDRLLILLGNYMLWLHKPNWNHVVTTLQSGAYLLQQLRKVSSSSNMAFWDFINPESFHSVAEAAFLCTTMHVDDTEDILDLSKTLELTSDICRLASLKKCLGIKNGDAKATIESQEFLGLMEESWTSEVSQVAEAANKRLWLPVENIDTVNSYLSQELTKLQLDVISSSTFKRAAILVQARLLLYNPLPAVHIQNIRCQAFLRRNVEKRCLIEKLKTVSVWDKHVLEFHDVVEVKGKDGCCVGVVLPSDTVAAMTYLTDSNVRTSLDVHNSQWIFATSKLGKELAYYSVTDVCSQVGVDPPVPLTSNLSRRFIAIVSQVSEDMKTEDLEWAVIHLAPVLEQLEMRQNWAKLVDRQDLIKLLLLLHCNNMQELAGSRLEWMTVSDICEVWRNGEGTLSMEDSSEDVEQMLANLSEGGHILEEVDKGEEADDNLYIDVDDSDGDPTYGSQSSEEKSSDDESSAPDEEVNEESIRKKKRRPIWDPTNLDADTDMEDIIVRDINNPAIYFQKNLYRHNPGGPGHRARRIRQKHLKHPCPFHPCKEMRKLYPKFANHVLSAKHIHEICIQKIRTLPDKERQRMLHLLRLRSTHEWNERVKCEGKGVILLARRSSQESTFDLAKYGPCPRCLDWIQMKMLSRHNGSCVNKDNQSAILPDSMSETEYRKLVASKKAGKSLSNIHFVHLESNMNTNMLEENLDKGSDEDDDDSQSEGVLDYLDGDPLDNSQSSDEESPGEELDGFSLETQHNGESSNNKEEDGIVREINNSAIYYRKSETVSAVDDKQKCYAKPKLLHPCPFNPCKEKKRFFAKLSRHVLSRKHADEPCVKKILEMSTNEEKKHCLLTLLRLKSIHEWNRRVVCEGRGEILLSGRHKIGVFDISKFGPCPKCLHWLHRRDLKLHKLHGCQNMKKWKRCKLGEVLTTDVPIEQTETKADGERQGKTQGQIQDETQVVVHGEIQDETKVVTQVEIQDETYVVTQGASRLPSVEDSSQLKQLQELEDKIALDSGSLWVSQTEKKKKVLACLFCGKVYKHRIIEHIRRNHIGEIEVQQVLKESSLQMQAKLLRKVKNRGNFNHNVRVLQTGVGNLILARGANYTQPPTHYLPCLYCLVFMKGCHLWNHIGKRCPETGGRNEMRGKGIMSTSQALLSAVVADSGDAGEGELWRCELEGVKKDVFFDAMARDSLLCAYGRSKLQKKSGRRSLNSLMLLTRLKFELIHTTSEQFSTFICEEGFHKMVSATKGVLGLSPDIDHSHSKSVVKCLGDSLARCARLERSQAMNRQDERRQAEAEMFGQLVTSQWRVKLLPHSAIPTASKCTSGGVASTEGNPEIQTSDVTTATTGIAANSVTDTREGGSQPSESESNAETHEDTTLVLKPNGVGQGAHNCERGRTGGDSGRIQVLDAEDMDLDNDDDDGEDDNDDDDDDFIPDCCPPNCKKRCHSKPKRGKGKRLQSQERSTDLEDGKTGESSIRIINRKVTKSKKNACYFCGHLVSKISRHLWTMHSKESLVVEALSLPKGSLERKRQLMRIIHIGNWYHNAKVLTSGSGDFIVVKRPPRDEVTVDDFIACVYCKGYYATNTISKHYRECQINAEDQIEPETQFIKGRLGLRTSRTFQASFTPSGEIDPVRGGLFGTMRMDDIGKICRNDSVIFSLGMDLVSKESTSNQAVRSQMRHMAKLLLTVREISSDKQPASLHQILVPESFDLVIEGIRKICKYTSERSALSPRFELPSLALRMGHCLKKCVHMKQSLCSERKDPQGEKEADHFLTLFERKYTRMISALALGNIFQAKEKKMSATPLTEDIVTFQTYIAHRIKSLCQELDSANEWDFIEVYRSLVKAALCYVIKFNRGSVRQIGKILVSDVRQDVNETEGSQVLQMMSPIEQQLSKRLDVIHIKRSCGSSVPVLLSPEVTMAVKKLTDQDCREKAGIAPDNIYVFPMSRGSVYNMHGGDALTQTVKEVELKQPSDFKRSTSCEYIAIVLQVLSMEENDIVWLASHFGLDTKTKEELHRHDELSRVAKLLLAADGSQPPLDDNNVNGDAGGNDRIQGDDLSDITRSQTAEKQQQKSQDEEEEDEEEELRRMESKKKRKCVKSGKRIPWSEETVSLLATHFGENIKKRQYPSFKEIRKLRDEHPDLLDQRTDAQIQARIEHLMKQKCKK